MSSEYIFEKRDPEEIKQATICLLIKVENSKRKILLAMKKRGFGEGFWNGPGGKPKSGETLNEATVREVKEEVDIEINKKDLSKVAILHFYFPEDKKSWDQDVHVFIATIWEGVPKESEEMKPEWFEEKDFPYDYMWRDDPYWMPEVLSGRKVEAWFVFEGEGQIAHQKIEDLK